MANSESRVIVALDYDNQQSALNLAEQFRKLLLALGHPNYCLFR